MTEGLLLFEDKHTWFVIIQDGDTSDCVITYKTVLAILVVKLDVEVFIRLPAIVVNDLNGNLSLNLSTLEDDFFVNMLVV